MNNFVAMNGEIVPLETLRISPDNRGLMYGDGCFETLRSFSGNFLAFDAHIQRLHQSMLYLNLISDIQKDDFYSVIQSLLQINSLALTDAIVRIQIWRRGGRGYVIDESGSDCLIQVSPVSDSKESVRLHVAKTPVIPSIALRRSTKLSNGLNYILAGQEAVKHLADDAILLTLDGYVSETTSSNLFWGIGDILFTPSTDCDLLHGITRNLLIKAIRRSRTIELEEKSYRLEHLLNADFVFVTNAVHGLIPVSDIDGTFFSVSNQNFLTIKKQWELMKNNILQNESA